ncbi:hypothetical protein EJB05_47175, partial [Eragrostis curvula]
MALAPRRLKGRPRIYCKLVHDASTSPLPLRLLPPRAPTLAAGGRRQAPPPPATTSPSFPALLRCGSEAPRALWWPKRLHRVVFHPGQRRDRFQRGGNGAGEGGALQLEAAPPPPPPTPNLQVLCFPYNNVAVCGSTRSKSNKMKRTLQGSLLEDPLPLPASSSLGVGSEMAGDTTVQPKQSSHGRRGWLED